MSVQGCSLHSLRVWLAALPHAALITKGKLCCAQSSDLTEVAVAVAAADGGLVTRGREGLELRAAPGSPSDGPGPRPGFVVSLSNRKNAPLPLYK